MVLRVDMILRFYSKYSIDRGWEFISGVELLPSKLKALDSVPSTREKNEKIKEM